MCLAEADSVNEPEASINSERFEGLSAWFSTSVAPNVISLWLNDGGVQVNKSDWAEADFIFGDSSTALDVKPIFDSDRYKSQWLTIFKSSWIKDVIARVNIRSDEADKNEEGEDEEDQSQLGTYILPHPIIQKELDRLQRGCPGGVQMPNSTSKFSAKRKQGSRLARVRSLAGPSRRLPNHSHRNQSNFDPWEFTDETTSTSNMATRRHKRCLEENDKPESSSSRSNRNPRVAESDQSHPGDIQTHSSQHSSVERSDSNLSEEFGMPVVTTTSESSTSARQLTRSTVGQRRRELRQKDRSWGTVELENANGRKGGEKNRADEKESDQRNEQNKSKVESQNKTIALSRRRGSNLQDKDGSDDQAKESDLGDQQNRREKRRSNEREDEGRSLRKRNKLTESTMSTPSRSRLRQDEKRDGGEKPVGVEKSGSDGQERSAVKDKRLLTAAATVDKGITSSFTSSMDDGIIHINDIVVPNLPLFDFVVNKNGCAVTMKLSCQFTDTD